MFRGWKLIALIAAATTIPSASWYTANGTGAVKRTQAAKLSDVVSVLDFGAKNDGSTDVTAAFQAAINAVSAAGGGDVYVPAGTYLKRNTAGIELLSNVRLRGAGITHTIINFDDVTPGGQGPCISGGGRTNIGIEDLQIQGQWQTNKNNTGNQAISISDSNYVTIRRVRVQDNRAMSIVVFANTPGHPDIHDVEISDCEVERSAIDAIRVIDAQNVIIVNNRIRHVNDDSIAVHNNNSTLAPVRDGIVITGNVIEDGLGIDVLEARNTTISNNIIRRPSCYGIQMGRANGFAEGASSTNGVTIVGNVIEDVINRNTIDARCNLGSYIRITPDALNAGGQPVAPGKNNTTAPGSVTVPYGYMMTPNPSGATPSPGSFFLTIANNQLVRTLQSGVTYSTYAFEENIFSATGFLNPSMTEAMFQNIGVEFQDPIRSSMIKDNVISTGDYGIKLTPQTTEGGTNPFDDLLIEGNHILDARTSGIYYATNSVGAIGANIIIRSNLINCDPWMLATHRLTHGKWDGTGGPAAIGILDLVGPVLERNIIQNCWVPIVTNGNTVYSARGNVLRARPVAVGFNANNIGIGAPVAAGVAWRYEIEDGDPANATYGQILQSPIDEAAAVPSSGTFVQGDYIRDTTGVTPGWIRLTTGSGNVFGTDWNLASTRLENTTVQHSGGATNITVNAATASNQATVQFSDQGTLKFYLGKHTDNSLLIWDQANSHAVWQYIPAATNGTLSLSGSLLAPTTIAFASLGTPSNGVIAYCSDCTIANPCAGGGTGAIAKRLNGVWVCN